MLQVTKILPFETSQREMKDAVRLAMQSAVAAAATYLAMQFIGMPEKFVGVLSAVLVIQPSVGNTMGEAWDRVAATLVGSAIGAACLLLLSGAYATAGALALSMLVINAVAGFRPEWRYGAVAAVALSLGAESEIWQTTQDRALAIGLGALIGIVVSLVVWPDSATERARRHLREAWRAIAETLDTTIDQARGMSETDTKEMRSRYHANMNGARDATDGIHFEKATTLSKQVRRTEQLYNAVLIVNRVAEETDQGTDGGDHFGQDLEAFREKSCNVLKAMAEGDHAQSGKLDDIDHAVDAARERVTESGGEAADQIERHALVFSLSEVAQSLRAIGETGND